jgi:septal ring factor EnvC (AmiA/AmiB activator)
MSNIGKLPWPTERGTIITHFGKHRHPHLNVTVDSKGVDFQCEKGSSARAVFEGEVKNVIDLPRYRAILVQHGDYFTVYSKLEEVYVNVGDVVNTKQSLGKIWTDNDTGETILYFEIRQQVAPQNPETWIIRR